VDGWYLAEPGSYTLQASLRSLGGHGGLGGDIVASPLTLRIASPRSWEEEYVAQNYFTDEVGRALALGGTTTMTSAIEALEEAANRLKGTAVARHAMLTLALPRLRSRKVLRLPEGEAPMSPAAADGGSIGVVEAKPDEANRLLREALLDDRREAVEAFGRADYERYVEMYATWLEQSGDKAAAARARSQTSETQRSESTGRAQSKGKPKRASGSGD
jgi:hypothetical protein